MSFAKDPASFGKILGCGQESIGTSAEDLATFLDMSPYEYILVLATCSVIGTSTNLTVKFVHSTASTGSSPVTVKDSAGSDISATIAGAGIADGNTLAFMVRTRGLNKWGSPQFTAASAAMGVAYTIIGLSPRDTSEVASSWTIGAGSGSGAHSTVVEASSGNAFT